MHNTPTKNSEDLQGDNIDIPHSPAGIGPSILSPDPPQIGVTLPSRRGEGQTHIPKLDGKVSESIDTKPDEGEPLGEREFG
jgi:hypothetical protein